MSWISIAEYCRRKGIRNPQVIYNKIAMGKFIGGVREIEVIKKLKQVEYEDD